MLLASEPLSADESLTKRRIGHFLQLMKSAHSSLLLKEITSKVAENRLGLKSILLSTLLQMKITVFTRTQPHCWIKKDELWRLPFCTGFDKSCILNWIWNRIISINIISISSSSSNSNSIITIFIM